MRKAALAARNAEENGSGGGSGYITRHLRNREHSGHSHDRYVAGK